MKINSDCYLFYLYYVSLFLNLHITHFHHYNLSRSDHISFKSMQYLIIYIMYNTVSIIDSIIQIREIYLDASDNLHLKDLNTSIEYNIIYYLSLILYNQSFFFIFYMHLLLNARVISNDKILRDVSNTVQHLWW